MGKRYQILAQENVKEVEVRPHKEGIEVILEDRNLVLQVHRVGRRLFFLWENVPVVIDGEKGGDGLLVRFRGKFYPVPLGCDGDGAPEKLVDGVYREESPMPALVKRLKAKEGQKVEPGDAIVVLEAMKMELEMKSPYAGILEQIFVKEQETLKAGTPLFEIRVEEMESDS